MESVLFLLTPVALLAVLIVLAIGLYSMMQNKGANLSQRLMRWRIGLQFVAILVIMGLIYLAR